MSRTIWKRVAPISMRNAIELCVKYAQEKKNLSVERIADRMGLESHWALYKWMESGRMPAILIRPFELATGATFVTQYIATSAHKLLIDVPQGQPAADDELLDLQSGFNEAINLLSKFYKEQKNADETVAALSQILGRIAGHRENVTKVTTPELALFGGEQ